MKKKIKKQIKLFPLYFKFVIFFTFLSLIIIGFTNYYVDVGNIYSPSIKDNMDKQTPKKFIEKLVRSKNGIHYSPNIWNVRDLKISLASQPTDADCAIFGGSRAMQISSARPVKSLKNICSSLINLSVNSAALEDYLIISKSLLQNNKPPKTIVMGIDPWIFTLNRDKRWRRYKNDFSIMKDAVEKNSKNFSIKTKLSKEPELNIALLINLINKNYFMRSIELVLSKENRSIKYAPELQKNYNSGIKEMVILPDGSLIYSKKRLKLMKANMTNGLLNYDIRGISDFKRDSGQWHQENAVKLFIQLVNYLKKHFKIVFVITPYHPSVWEIKNQPLVKALKHLEKKTHILGKSLNVQVIGSYNPNIIGCTKEEFFDLIHPKDVCLSNSLN